MALKTETKTIGGVEYLIGQLPATRSVKLLARLGRVLGPALGQVAKMIGDADPEKPIGAQDLDLDAAGGVLQALFLTLDDAEIDGLLRELFSSVAAVCEGGGPFEGSLKKIDAHFSGDRVGDLFRVAFASLEVNFGGFFGVLAALAPKGKRKAAGLVASPSAGSST